MDPGYINDCRVLGVKPMSLGEYVRNRCNASDYDRLTKVLSGIKDTKNNNVYELLNTVLRKVSLKDTLFDAVLEYKYGMMDYNNLSLVRH